MFTGKLATSGNTKQNLEWSKTLDDYPKGKLLTVAHEPVEEVQLDDEKCVTDQGPLEALCLKGKTYVRFHKEFGRLEKG